VFLANLLSGRSRPSRTTTGPSAASGWWQPFIDAGLLGVETDSGQQVGPETSLNYHAWFRAMSLIAQKVASVPKHLLRRSADGEGKDRARDHVVYKLVHERANEEQTAFQFWLQMGGHVPSRGNGYAAIYRVKGVPVELIPMDPDRTYPVRRDGELWYVTFPFGHQGEGLRLRPVEVLHFRGWGYDGLVGYPVWSVAKEEIGLGRAERKLSATRFKNNARPSMVLQTDMRMDPKARERLRNEWEQMHRGVDNAWRTAILDNGLKATPVSLSAEQLGQTEGAQMSLTAISNYTGVPVSKLGGSGKSYASQEQEDRAFVNDGLDFWLNVFEDETGAKLLTDPEREQGYEVKGNREALLRPDTRTKFEVLRIATAGKPIMTQNESRRMIDLPPVDEEGADELGTPLNMGTGGIDNNPRDFNDPDPGRPDGAEDEEQREVRNAAATAVLHASRKLVKRVAFHANRLASKPGEFLAMVDGLKADHGKVFDEEMTPAEQAARAVSFQFAGPVGWAGAKLLDTIHAELSALAQTATAKDLAPKVAALTADQEKRLPRFMLDLMLGESR
jgi:HK97 family phage portal protein